MTGIRIVQSLNSPFFPPLVGAEPGRAKEESRITCMRMLRTNQWEVTSSQPRCSRQRVAQCLFQLALWKKLLWRSYCEKKKQHKNVKIEIWFIVVCTLIDNEYATFLFSQTLFFILLQDFWKKSLTRTSSSLAHLHNAARALSSPSRCFNCQQILAKISFVIFDIAAKNKSNVV